MSDRPAKSRVASLVLQTPPPLTEQPAAVYLSGLGPGSRRTMRQALNVIAQILTNGGADALTLDWAALRYKHTAALRAALIQKYAPATTNKMLGGLRRVLKEALLLELMDPQDYASRTRQKCSDSLGNQRTAFVSPFEWFSHSLVEVSNEG